MKDQENMLTNSIEHIKKLITEGSDSQINLIMPQVNKGRISLNPLAKSIADSIQAKNSKKDISTTVNETLNCAESFVFFTFSSEKNTQAKIAEEVTKSVMAIVREELKPVVKEFGYKTKKLFDKEVKEYKKTSKSNSKGSELIEEYIESKLKLADVWEAIENPENIIKHSPGLRALDGLRKNSNNQLQQEMRAKLTSAIGKAILEKHPLAIADSKQLQLVISRIENSRKDINLDASVSFEDDKSGNARKIVKNTYGAVSESSVQNILKNKEVKALLEKLESDNYAAIEILSDSSKLNIFKDGLTVAKPTIRSSEKSSSSSKSNAASSSGEGSPSTTTKSTNSKDSGKSNAAAEMEELLGGFEDELASRRSSSASLQADEALSASDAEDKSALQEARNSAQELEISNADEAILQLGELQNVIQNNTGTTQFSPDYLEGLIDELQQIPSGEATDSKPLDALDQLYADLERGDSNKEAPSLSEPEELIDELQQKPITKAKASQAEDQVVDSLEELLNYLEGGDNKKKAPRSSASVSSSSKASWENEVNNSLHEASQFLSNERDEASSSEKELDTPSSKSSSGSESHSAEKAKPEAVVNSSPDKEKYEDSVSSHSESTTNDPTEKSADKEKLNTTKGFGDFSASKAYINNMKKEDEKSTKQPKRSVADGYANGDVSPLANAAKKIGNGLKTVGRALAGAAIFVVNGIKEELRGGHFASPAEALGLSKKKNKPNTAKKNEPEIDVIDEDIISESIKEKEIKKSDSKASTRSESVKKEEVSSSKRHVSRKIETDSISDEENAKSSSTSFEESSRERYSDSKPGEKKFSVRNSKDEEPSQKEVISPIDHKKGRASRSFAKSLHELEQAIDKGNTPLQSQKADEVSQIARHEKIAYTKNRALSKEFTDSLVDEVKAEGYVRVVVWDAPLSVVPKGEDPESYRQYYAVKEDGSFEVVTSSINEDKNLQSKGYALIIHKPVNGQNAEIELFDNGQVQDYTKLPDKERATIRGSNISKSWSSRASEERSERDSQSGFSLH
ncbi:MAG: hypothetical protein K0R98_1162 [Rickettsiaceae bacterium]|jgi:hypothetical protein|nr:hypothetical protein [Rickettsiaceae bacterium]